MLSLKVGKVIRNGCPLNNHILLPMAITNREIINRRAKFEYHFVQEFEAGIVLTGTEVKAIRWQCQSY